MFNKSYGTSCALADLLSYAILATSGSNQESLDVSDTCFIF